MLALLVRSVKSYSEISSTGIPRMLPEAPQQLFHFRTKREITRSDRQDQTVGPVHVLLARSNVPGVYRVLRNLGAQAAQSNIAFRLNRAQPKTQGKLFAFGICCVEDHEDVHLG